MRAVDTIGATGRDVPAPLVSAPRQAFASAAGFFVCTPDMPRLADNTPLTPEQSALAARNVPLVRYVVRSLRKHGGVRRLGFDEAIAVGCLALVKAARRYDRSRSYDAKGFAAYACVAIRQAIYQAANSFLKLVSLPPSKNFVTPACGRKADALCRMYGDLYERRWLVPARSRA